MEVDRDKIKTRVTLIREIMQKGRRGDLRDNIQNRSTRRIDCRRRVVLKESPTEIKAERQDGH